MITKEEFMRKVDVKRKKTVDNWLEKGLVPGVITTELGELLFPDSARRPATPRCSKNVDSIMCSMVNACMKQKHISKEIYKLSSSEFESIVSELTNANILRKRKDNGIVYYDVTLESINYLVWHSNNSSIRRFIIDCVEAGAKGTTSAMLDFSKSA